jgi:hypothetical protein
MLTGSITAAVGKGMISDIMFAFIFKNKQKRFALKNDQVKYNNQNEY